MKCKGVKTVYHWQMFRMTGIAPNRMFHAFGGMTLCGNCHYPIQFRVNAKETNYCSVCGVRIILDDSELIPMHIEESKLDEYHRKFERKPLADC